MFLRLITPHNFLLRPNSPLDIVRQWQGGTDVKILKGLDGLVLPGPIGACQSPRPPCVSPFFSYSVRALPLPRRPLFSSPHRSGLVSGSTLACARRCDRVTGGRSETRGRRKETKRARNRQAEDGVSGKRAGWEGGESCRQGLGHK